MARTLIDIHILQNVPPSNLNRDDTGAPKTAVYGGVRRARVSSQAWKRATRKSFGDFLPPSELGVRTRKVAEALAEHIRALDAALDSSRAVELAAETLRTATGSKIEPPQRKAKKTADGAESEPAAAPESAYLMYLSRRQLDALAELTLTGAKGGDPAALKKFFKDKEHKNAARRAVDTGHSVDIALFGRMVADSTDLNVDAATQVAHAIGVHRSDVESDYYTAVDDRNRDDETGAGMIGSIDFHSATLYRYAALDVDALHRNLGPGLRQDEAPSVPTQRAVAAFLEGFITSLPTGKINTFGNHTLPAAVLVKLRTRRPISFVDAFEQPVARAEDGGYLAGSCARLVHLVPELERQYEVADDDHSWVLRVGPDTKELAALGKEVTLRQLLEEVADTVAARLESGA
ncbi:type I-E CRISPR-associated protein Cas7/Cse4/CasC [Streptomyces sp. XM4011]|uniref:type I-E CRISPR-associated protein Cas7/Cse4/CasC n=1 Tax=Streptomyces sp. XM4011 TaxID=2929780 RepID=UPI001FFA3436|nr:type I-E CRISPR-associated protein Cas7/Cse4/CasC [Streptomyces sp. XM4011]MCK1816237.1 type I-E CRISPR-associated protein Cas7/Cse4/CasC [Streptomyces sp. XM4011]